MIYVRMNLGKYNWADENEELYQVVVGGILEKRLSFILPEDKVNEQYLDEMVPWNEWLPDLVNLWFESWMLSSQREQMVKLRNWLTDENNLLELEKAYWIKEEEQAYKKFKMYKARWNVALSACKDLGVKFNR